MNASIRPYSLIVIHFAGGRMISASNVAIPGACLCIQRRIYHAISDSLEAITTSARQVRVSWLLWKLYSNHKCLQESTQDYFRCGHLCWFSSHLPAVRYVYVLLCKYDILHSFAEYILQPVRYDIYEDFGCRIDTLSTALTVVLIPVPRLAICLVSGGYGCKIVPSAPQRFNWKILRLEYVSHLDQRTRIQVHSSLFNRNPRI
jgi:Pheromone A receptor